MRNIIVSVLVMIASFNSCTSIFKDASKDSFTEKYETNKIRYERTGGGNLDFTISYYGNDLLVNITRMDFHDTDLHLTIAKTDIDPNDLKMIESLFNGTVDISGVLPVNPLPTGTWNYVYVLIGDKWLKVGDKAVVNELSSFEQLVRSKIR